MQYLLTPQEYSDLKLTKITQKEYDEWYNECEAVLTKFTHSLGELGIRGGSNQEPLVNALREVLIKISSIHRGRGNITPPSLPRQMEKP